jgi:cysteine desulfurase
MGRDPILAAGSLRVSLGWGSTRSDIDRLLGALPRIVEKLRGVSAVSA